MNKIIGLSFLLLFTACNEKEQNEQKTVPEQKTEVISTDNPSVVKKGDILEQLGFTMNGEKVTIDINKTNDFFKQMEIQMHGKADEIERKIENADLNFSKDFGISLSEEHISIDLNKTKDMLQHINILMKDILLDANHTIH